MLLRSPLPALTPLLAMPIACAKSTSKKTDPRAPAPTALAATTTLSGTILKHAWQARSGKAKVMGDTVYLDFLSADPATLAVSCVDGDLGTTEWGAKKEHGALSFQVPAQKGVHAHSGFTQDVEISWNGATADDYELDSSSRYEIEITELTATKVSGKVTVISTDNGTSIAGPFSVERCAQP